MALLVALRTDKEFEAVKAFVTSKSYGGFCVREAKEDNEHWHWLLEVSAKNVQTFRVLLTRTVPELKGNSAYSATEVADLAKYERYMCKGDSEGQKPEVVWTQSVKYTPAKIDELHAAYWLENSKLKKRKVGSMLDYVVDEAKRQNVSWRDRKALSLIYVREVKARARPLNLFAARATMNTVQMLLCPNDTMEDEFAEQI